jgi:hypothetical protein
MRLAILPIVRSLFESPFASLLWSALAAAGQPAWMILLSAFFPLSGRRR